MNEIQIVIPTYNASKVILATISEILMRSVPSHIIIVDDNSPDKTAKIVKNKFKKNKQITVLIRNQKQGRGSAVLHGFKYALKDKKTQYFIEMDADLCHDPKYITKMISMSKDADVVIASKNLKGSVITGLSRKRIVLSKFMNLAARIILHVPITDYSNGYRLYKRPVIEFLTKQKLSAKGFVFLSESIYLIYKKGFVIKEIPFHFKQYAITKSNLNMHEIREAITVLFKLRFFEKINY